MYNYYWIPAVGEPQLIESEESVNKVWHDLMNDPDHHLLFESVHNRLSSDIVFLVDECGKLKPHAINKFASLFYPGTSFGDYIAGNVLICKIIDVPYTEDNEVLFYEKDLGSLTSQDITLINYFLYLYSLERKK